MIRRLARWAVLATAAPAVLMSFAYLTGDVDTWWVELLHYVPYPAYLLPALVALALSFMLRWPWRIVATVTLLLVLTVIMGLAVGHGDEGIGRVRMMTYNVKAMRARERENGFEELAAEVARHNPDILVMQDAGDLSQAHYERPGLVPDLFVKRYVFQHGQYIVLTRFPLRDCRVETLPSRGLSTDYVHCVITVQGTDIDLVTAHLLSPRRGLNATRHEPVEGIDDWQQNFDDRLKQARKIAADIAGHTRPMILAGDLNAAEASPVIRALLAQGLRDAYSSAGIGYGYSHGHALRVGFSFLRIDHILVSPEIGVVDAYPGGWQASEHRPVIADLVLQRAPH